VIEAYLGKDDDGDAGGSSGAGPAAGDSAAGNEPEGGGA